jgi:hypothetical protein
VSGSIIEVSQEAAPTVEVLEDDIEVVVQDETTQLVEVELGIGPQGPPGETVVGPEGPQGPAGETIVGVEDKTYRHQQFSPDTTWVVVHNLGKRPSVQTFDSSGDEVEGAIVHISDNELHVSFSADTGGEAYLN